MLAEWGTLFLALALVFCLAILILPLKYNHPNAHLFLQRATIAYSLCIFLAVGCLMLAFLRYDFTLWSVYSNANADLPWWYRLGATWGHHEGSLLLWCALLSLWSAGVAFFPRRLCQKTHRLVLSCLALLESGFLVFLLLTSSPFARFFPTEVVPAQTLTPILQDPGLMFHPPLLYLGYVGFAVGFAYAVSALIEGKLDSSWCRSLRVWVGLSWAFLTLGIVLGSWWAYRELGWGGWWFWDPVENASLMPWLCATALMHSLIVSEKQQAFKAWVVALALLCFALSLLGTFLVRSGVLVSVHAFASDPSRGVFLLLFLSALWVGSMILFALRAHRLKSTHSFELLSRETFLLWNSVVILSLLATVVLGTVYPIILDSVHSDKITVGTPYYNAVFVPIVLPLLLIMAIAPLVRWKTQNFSSLIFKIRAPLGGALIITMLIAFYDPLSRAFWTISSLFVAFFIILATLLDWYQHLRKQSLRLRRFAMILAHLGVAVLVLGISINKSHSRERQVKMQLGQSVLLENYRFTLEHLSPITTKTYHGTEAEFRIDKATCVSNSSRSKVESLGHAVNTSLYARTPHPCGSRSQVPYLGSGTLVFQKIGNVSSTSENFDISQSQVTKTGIQMTVWRDLYIALGQKLDKNTWIVRVYYKPFVRWIWAGGILVFIGILLTFTTRRKAP